MAHKARLALEALLAVRQGRRPHRTEVPADYEVGAGRPIRVDCHLTPRLLDLVRHVATLHASEVEVGLVVDTPLAVDQEVAVLVVEGRVGVHVYDRRHTALVVHEVAGIDTQGSLLEGPEPPRRLGVGRAVHDDVGGVGQVQHFPEFGYPRSGGCDHMVYLDHAAVGHYVGHGTAVDHQLGDHGVGHHAHALGLGLRKQGLDGGHIVGVAALLLVQDAGDAGGPPVAEDALHVVEGGLLAVDEHRLVSDRLLLLVDRGHVVTHLGVGDLEVADGVVLERLGVRLPHLDGVGHELAHGRLEVVVADHAAGDAGRSGAGM